jgi:hypothetical protein
VCDETVDGAPRYAFDAVITTGAAPSEVRDAFITNMAGIYAYSGGKHLIRPGYWVPVSEVLSEDDLAGPIQVSPFLSADSAATEVQGTYISPEDSYQARALATQSVTSTDVRQVEVDLAFTTNFDQGNRVLRIMLRRANAEKIVVWPMNIMGIKTQAMDTVQCNSDRYSLSNYAFSVANWSLSADFGVVLSLREENEEIYGDPTPVTPATPPTITQPTDPLPTVGETQDIIAASYAVGLTFSINTTGDVTISNHTRAYRDKNVSVTGTGGTPIATGATAGQIVFIYYDDATRAGGAVTYHYLTLPSTGGDASSASASVANPYRHFVLSGVVPASGSTGGGSDPGSGGGGSGGFCVTSDTEIELADGTTISAGQIKRYMQLRTQHEETLEEGIYHVTAVKLVPDQEVFKVEVDGKTLRATAGHRIWIGDQWQRAADLGVADGLAEVVQITVADAHTYKSNALLSHNVKIAQDP